MSPDAMGLEWRLKGSYIKAADAMKIGDVAKIAMSK
jgi:hypothetical protein